MKTELEEKMKKYCVSPSRIEEETIDYCDLLSYKISEFKKLLDRFLDKHGSKDGEIRFVVDHDQGYYRDDMCTLQSRIVIETEFIKTEDQLLIEVTEAELREKKRKEAHRLAAKRRQDKVKETKEKEEAKERELYEKLKKKFEAQNE